MSQFKRSKSEENSHDVKTRTIRIAVLGATGVGKSSIISQFLYKVFNEDHIETIEDLYRKHLTMFDRNVILDILDTAGHSDFQGMRNLALTVSDAFVLVYSMADYRSFNEVNKLRDEILSQRPEVPIVIVANKSDVQSGLDIVDRETAEAIVRIDWGCGFIQVSAKNDTNIEQIFQAIISLTTLTTLVKHESPSAANLRRCFSLGSAYEKSAKKGKRNGCPLS